MCKRLVLVFGFFLAVSGPALAGFSDGMSAFRAGNYDAAADEWFLLAKAGQAKAQNNMAYLYSRGLGVEKDLQQSLEWYTRAAEQGYAIAQYNLGLIFAKGKFVKKDEGAATQWLRAAAEQGHLRAQVRLAKHLMEGRGVTRNDVQAYAWLVIASERAKDKLLGRITARQAKLRKVMSGNETYLAERTAENFAEKSGSDGTVGVVAARLVNGNPTR